MSAERTTTQRLKSFDTYDMCATLSGGNPGALSVCTQLVKQALIIDPMGLGGIGPFLNLDMYGIYGSDIWVLYKRCCGQSILNFITVLRACQLGLYNQDDLWAAIRSASPIDIDPLYTAVKEELPSFNGVVGQV